MGVYSRILRSPNVAALLAATTLGGLPFGINGLAVVDGEGWSAAVAIGVAGAAVGALLGFARRGAMLPALAR